MVSSRILMICSKQLLCQGFIESISMLQWHHIIWTAKSDYNKALFRGESRWRCTFLFILSACCTGCQANWVKWVWDMKGGFCTPNISDSILISSVIFFLTQNFFNTRCWNQSNPPITAVKGSLERGILYHRDSLRPYLLGSLDFFFFFKSSKFNLLIQLIKMCGLWSREQIETFPLFLHGHPLFLSYLKMLIEAPHLPTVVLPFQQ